MIDLRRTVTGVGESMPLAGGAARVGSTSESRF